MNQANVAGDRPLSQFLRMAVVAGVESAVQIHIERGDDLNARDASGMTPLMLCAVRNKPAICKLLLGAGADHGLLDRSGKTALQIAIAAGAKATAAILEAVRAPPSASESEQEPGRDRAPEPAPPARLMSDAAPPVEPPSAPEPTDAETAAVPSPQGAAPPAAPVLDETDGGEFDLSGWEAEEEPVRPEVNREVEESASAVQTAITAHKPIDSSAGWDDIEAHLPEAALPLVRADNAQGRARLRLLLLRALREGSVPALEVRDLSANEDGSANPDAEAFLAMIINDLGAEADERFEYSSADETFEVFVAPEESADEEAALDEALAAIDQAASSVHEPLRVYQREFQRLRLLRAEEEIQLAKDMENALDVALTALATWPHGIAQTLAAGAEALAGSRPLSTISAGSEPDAEPGSAESLEPDQRAYTELQEASDDEGEQAHEQHSADGDLVFAHALTRLAGLLDGDDGPKTSAHEIRHALANLRLNRRFLLELIEHANGAVPCPAFAHAMADFRKARDRMTAANLKLSFFHAKKYLHSGEPLDDLAQEGNIGLLKAVDRYDWRRGFRFSTYATWWIRQQISRYVADKVRTIRVPVHIHEKLQRAVRSAQDFESAAGREPILEELAERVEMLPDKLAALLRIAPEPSSIDAATVDDMIAIDDRDAFVSPDPADVVSVMQLNKAVERYISSLSTKDRKEERILRMHFGIGVPEPLTLEEIGIRFDVTRERIRQIEAKALKKLQNSGRSAPFARTALGFSLEAPAPYGPGTQEDDLGLADIEIAPPPAAPKRSEAARRPRKPTQPLGLTRPAALERLLAQATELGIPVHDDRASSGNIWVELLEARDSHHRRLVRSLVSLGFVFWPGKGYWQ